MVKKEERYLLSDGLDRTICFEAPCSGNDFTCFFLREVQMRATQSTTMTERGLRCIWYRPGS